MKIQTVCICLLGLYFSDIHEKQGPDKTDPLFNGIGIVLFRAVEQQHG